MIVLVLGNFLIIVYRGDVQVENSSVIELSKEVENRILGC